MKTCPLSSVAPRPYRMPSRIVGSNGGVFHSIERVLRLHVVVPVDQHALGALALHGGPDDRLAADIDQAGLEAQPLQMVRDPLGAGPRVAVVLLLGADRRDAHELLELFDKAILVRVDVGFHSIRHSLLSS